MIRYAHEMRRARHYRKYAVANVDDEQVGAQDSNYALLGQAKLHQMPTECPCYGMISCLFLGRIA